MPQVVKIHILAVPLAYLEALLDWYGQHPKFPIYLGGPVWSSQTVKVDGPKEFLPCDSVAHADNMARQMLRELDGPDRYLVIIRSVRGTCHRCQESVNSEVRVCSHCLAEPDVNSILWTRIKPSNILV